jgi:GMP synthase (glutamine-hydrolysing)
MSNDPRAAPIPRDVRVLLIQVRDVPDVALHELECIRGVTGLGAQQIDQANLVHEPRLEWDRVARADAVIIGGAGVHSAVEDYDFSDHLTDLIERMVGESVALFGSCYGHQIVARTLGGSVVHDTSRAEVGAIDVTMTDAAAQDPLFGACPASYTALMGHQDRVDRLPEGAIELAYSETCRNQAFRLEGRPVWCTQFHAELSPTTLVERLSHYRHYAPEEDEFERIKQGLRPTPHACEVLRRFLALCVAGKGAGGGPTN